MDLPAAYQSAQTGAVYYQVEGPGLLRLHGQDQLAFIQRQATNNIQQLGPDAAQVSVLTTPTARIIDVFFLYQQGTEDGGFYLNLITLPGRATATARYLTNRIFFMDQVSLSDLSAEVCQLYLDGPQAAGLLQKLGGSEPPLTDGVRQAKLAGQAVVVIGRRGLNERGFLLQAPTQAAGELIAALHQAGAAKLSAGLYSILRIEAGLPDGSSELNEAYTPLETGLAYAISDNKGCYTGQEVIARQINYDKITRQMVGLRLAEPCSPGSQVFFQDRPAGETTSSAVSPRFGAIALAVLKRPYFDVGTSIQVQEGSSVVPGMVSRLPFA